MKANYYGVKICRLGYKDKRLEALAANMAAHMRKADRDELAAMDIAPYEAAMGSLKTSTEKYAAIAEDGTLLCLFGVRIRHENGAKYGIIWALGTEALQRHNKALYGAGMDYIREKKTDCRTLCNYITVNNKKALRFIKKAGASFDQPFQINRKDWIVRFEIRKEDPLCAASARP